MLHWVVHQLQGKQGAKLGVQGALRRVDVSPAALLQAFGELQL